MAVILVADDDPMTSLILLHALEDMGHFAWPAANGEEAWKLLNCVVFDLLITDVYMPILDGIGLIDLIRRSDKLARLPILVLSGCPATELDTLSGYESIAIMMKPVHCSKLKETAELLLKKSTCRDDALVLAQGKQITPTAVPILG